MSFQSELEYYHDLHPLEIPSFDDEAGRLAFEATLTPDQRLVYTQKDTNQLYHWDGTTGQPIPGDVPGQFVGSADTLATLPTTIAATGEGVTTGDFAILKEEDGTNEPGRYIWDGTQYVFDSLAGGKTEHIFTDWAANGATVTPTYCNGVKAVRVEDTSATALEFIELTENIPQPAPLSTDKFVTIKICKEATADYTAHVQLTGTGTTNADFLFNPATGAYSVDETGPWIDPEVLSAKVGDDFIEYVVRFPAMPLIPAVNWRLYPASHTTGFGGSANRVGSISVVDFEISDFNPIVLDGISADPDQQLTLGSDNLPYLGPECTDVTEQFVTGATVNPGGTTPSGITVTEITVNKTHDITIVHTGTSFTGGAGAGLGVSSIPFPTETANVMAAADIFSSTGDRIDATIPSKTYTVSLTPGTYYIGVWSGGNSSTATHTLDVTYCKPEVDVDVLFVESRCYEEPGVALPILDNDAFADEINSTQLATLPAGSHMRWTAPSAVTLDTLEVNGFNGTVTISWSASTGDTGSQSVTFGANPQGLNLGIALPAGGTIDFTLDSISAGQMQLTTPATSIANGWTALQDYSAFANTSHWATRLLTSTAAVEHTVNVYEDTNGDTVYAEVNGEDLTDLATIPTGWSLCPVEPATPIVSADANNSITEGTDGGAFFDARPSDEEGNLTITGDDGRVYSLPLKSETCYRELIDAPLAGSEFTLDNTTGGPSNAGVTFGTSQIFHNPDRQIFFDTSVLPFGARIKSVSMYEERRGNNTAPVRMQYGAVGSSNINVAAHANGYSATPSTTTFATSQLVDAATPLILVDPSQNHWDYAPGAGADFIASITPGTATASGGANDGVTSSIDGFNATVTFELSQGGEYTVREYSDGETTKLIYFDATGAPIELAAIPATWEVCPEPEDLTPRVEALENAPSIPVQTVIGEWNGIVDIDATINTGLDLTQETGMNLKIYSRDAGGSASWGIQEISVDDLLRRYSANANSIHQYLHLYSDDYITMRVVNPSTGEIFFDEFGRNFEVYKIELIAVREQKTAINTNDAQVNNSSNTAETEYNIEGTWLGNQRYTQTAYWTGSPPANLLLATTIDPAKVIRVEGIGVAGGGSAWSINTASSGTAGNATRVNGTGTGIEITEYGGFSSSNGGHVTVHYYK